MALPPDQALQRRGFIHGRLFHVALGDPESGAPYLARAEAEARGDAILAAAEAADASLLAPRAWERGISEYNDAEDLLQRGRNIEYVRDNAADATRYFREAMTSAGFDIKPGIHPIVPVMLYDAPLSQAFAARLLEEGIYVIGFFFPVVPRGEARIRVQISAAHEKDHLDRAIEAFTKVGRDLGVLKN